jgi:hypothetical protein
MAIRPQVIVEFGSGASTLVIADALRQNGFGKLISIEHSDHYGAQTLSTLQAERLESWVDLSIRELEAWEGEHLDPDDAEKPLRWYPVSQMAVAVSDGEAAHSERALGLDFSLTEEQGKG